MALLMIISLKLVSTCNWNSFAQLIGADFFWENTKRYLHFRPLLHTKKNRTHTLDLVMIVRILLWSIFLRKKVIKNENKIRQLFFSDSCEYTGFEWECEENPCQAVLDECLDVPLEGVCMWVTAPWCSLWNIDHVNMVVSKKHCLYKSRSCPTDVTAA